MNDGQCPVNSTCTAPFKSSYVSAEMGFGLGGSESDAGHGGRRLDGMGMASL